MRAGITRRSAVTGLGASIGLGTAAGVVVLKGCGGGGADDSGGGGGGGGGSGSALPGSFWYKFSDGNLYTVAGGIAQPIAVNKVLSNLPNSSSGFGITRSGPRYLQLSQISVIPYKAVINVYEHTDHRAYCFINVDGYVSEAAVSLSGNYVMVRRSATLADSVFSEGSLSAINDLMIIDISDVNNIRAIRNTRTERQAAVYGFQWLADDRFVYMNWGDGNYGDSMYMGSAAAGSSGDRLLGKIDKQGLRIGEFSVHPDESTMLLSMFDRDGATLGVWDVYLYTLNGQPIARVTAVDQGYAGSWSPDGNYVYFQYGNGTICAEPACTANCSAHVIASSQRSVSLSATQQLDGAKVPCVFGPSWRA